MLNIDTFFKEGLDIKLVNKLKHDALDFLMKCQTNSGFYKLSHKSDTSNYALCFAIFLYHFIGSIDKIKSEVPFLINELVTSVYESYEENKDKIDLRRDKPFLQLLTFSLSAIHILNGLKTRPFQDIISFLIPKNMDYYLKSIGAYKGVPRSGNLAMFMAILSIYGRDFLGISFDRQISDWVEGHLKNMNKFGFWAGENITHLQFQNGFHQYEIFEYLKIKNPKINNAIKLIKKISDKRGQFAPYFGGSGCYDYDAISIITSPEYNINKDDIMLLAKSVNTILSEQNNDGGFSDSQWVRPRNFKNIYNGLNHVISGKGFLKKERLKYFLALQLPKNTKINTHWDTYSRDWNESNLWDTWFRLLTLARVDIAVDKKNLSRWGFINFPGIGFYNKT